jgi:hypothetical protein
MIQENSRLNVKLLSEATEEEGLGKFGNLN